MYTYQSKSYQNTKQMLTQKGKLLLLLLIHVYLLSFFFAATAKRF
jgi:hypothetical protein